MPSMVLLMRSRLRMRPLSFSIRMPSSSSYWRLILRRPASSLGRSSSSSCSSASVIPTKRSTLDLVLRDLATELAPKPGSAGTRAIAAVLLTNPEEALLAEAGVEYHLGLGAAAWTHVLARSGTPAFRGLCLFLCHRDSLSKKPGQFQEITRPVKIREPAGLYKT